MILQQQRILGMAVGAMAWMLLMGTAVPLTADEIKGKVAGVAADKNEVAVTETLKNWTFQLNPDAKVFINERESRLFEVRAGDDATITFSRQGEKFLASMVRCRRK